MRNVNWTSFSRIWGGRISHQHKGGHNAKDRHHDKDVGEPGNEDSKDAREYVDDANEKEDEEEYDERYAPAKQEGDQELLPCVALHR